jgi:hypothetical protein
MASGVGVAFVVLATILLAATLFGVLLWLVFAVAAGFGKGRRA